MSSLQSFPTNGGQGVQDIFSQTILGCPVRSFQALETICPVTGYPACAAATPEASWDASCCGSIAVFGSSVGKCYSENAPSCLDLSAAKTFLSPATMSGAMNPCASFALGGPTVKQTVSSATQTGSGGSTPSKTGAGSASPSKTRGATSASATGTTTGTASKSSLSGSSTKNATESATAKPTGAGAKKDVFGWKASLGFAFIVVVAGLQF